MPLDLDNRPLEERYRLFEALSHPTRARILKLVEERRLTFSSLKHELGLESSGQLQHHLQKLSGFVTVEKDGCYGLTQAGRQALDLYSRSEESGTSLEAVCCLPTRLDAPGILRVGSVGTALRFMLAGILLALTVALVATGQVGLRLSGASIFVGFGLSAAVVGGFFAVSFLIAGLEREPGCEVTAVPNLLAGKRKYYCSCLITPFNLPNGRLLEPSPR